MLLRFSFLPLFLRFSDKFRDIFRKKLKSYANFLHTVSKSAIMKDIKKLIFIGARPPLTPQIEGTGPCVGSIEAIFVPSARSYRGFLL